MADVREINPHRYNDSLAEALKKFPEFQKPEWIDFVKTSASKERPTFEQDFWHKRAASILRQIYVKKVVGVQRLRTRYGGKKNRGVRPAHFFRGGGKIIRVILQQSEKAGLLEKSTGKPGRQLTAKGKQLLESIK